MTATTVLLCGASGFIGRHVQAALAAAGCRVVPVVSVRRAGAGRVAADFARDTAPADWRPRLAGIDAVVNAVGVLRDSAERPMQAVHADAPLALAEAAADAGVRRFVQVSALGIDGNDTVYARSKRDADTRLHALHAEGRLAVQVLRPSLVVGPGGASTALFAALARLPLVAWPRIALRTRLQPLHVGDLAAAIAALVTAAEAPDGRCLELGGPDAVTPAALVAGWRAGAGRAPARTLVLPDALARCSARAGDAVPLTPWGRQAFSLLAQDNLPADNALPRLLGRAPRAILQGADDGRA